MLNKILSSVLSLYKLKKNIDFFLSLELASLYPRSLSLCLNHV